VCRLFPTKPGTGLEGLKVATTAYQVLRDVSKKSVASEVHQFAGGRDGFGPEHQEWVAFYVHIPLEPAELDAEARRYLTKMVQAMAPDQAKQFTAEARQRGLERLREFVYQHRLGHFQVECRILDGDRVMGLGIVELEVLFKSCFSDLGLPAVSPA
jgi:hypothetical protein